MKPTRAWHLVAYFVALAVAGYLVGKALIGRGISVPVSGLNVQLSLVAMGLVLVGLAWPVIRYRRGMNQWRKSAVAANRNSALRPKPIDPFYAVRLLMLAKACSIAAAAFAGGHVGFVLVQLESPVPFTAASAQNLWAVGASIVLLVCALIVEWLCRVRQDAEPESAGAARNSEASAA